MDIFWRLLLAHLLADFTLQTDRLAAWKRRSAAGCLTHSLVFGACGLLLCADLLSVPWTKVAGVSLNGWVVVALLTAAHFAEDQWRIWSIRRNGAPDSFAFFLWDQLVHVFLIFLLSASPDGAHAHPLVFLGIFAVLATHFASILLYFAARETPGYEPPRESRPLLMLQRLVTGGLVLMPMACAFPAGIVWAAVLVRRYLRPDPDSGWRYVLAGNLLALMSALLIRRLAMA